MKPPLTAEEVRRLASKYGMTPKVAPMTDDQIDKLRTKKHSQSYKVRCQEKGTQ